MLYPLYRKNGRQALEAAFAAEKGTDWTAEISNQSYDDWWDDVCEFIPGPVKEVMNKSRLPYCYELQRLKFYPDDYGVYLDCLEARPSTNFFKPQPRPSTGKPHHIYPGTTTHQPVHVRRSAHNNPAWYKVKPNNNYYRVKHDPDSPPKSTFVSLARIPIPTTLAPEETARRRILCRIAEAMFAFWLGGFDDSCHLVKISSDLQARLYGTNQSDYKGTASHSPLTECLGDHDNETLQDLRYKETMEAYTAIYGSIDSIPQEIIRLVERRSKRDTVRARQARAARTERNRPEYREEQLAENAARNKEARENWSSERRREHSAYNKAYHKNQWAQMTETERQDQREHHARIMRKSNVTKRLGGDLITFEKYLEAEANDWYLSKKPAKRRGNSQVVVPLTPPPTSTDLFVAQDLEFEVDMDVNRSGGHDTEATVNQPVSFFETRNEAPRDEGVFEAENLDESTGDGEQLEEETSTIFDRWLAKHQMRARRYYVRQRFADKKITPREFEKAKENDWFLNPRLTQLDPNQPLIIPSTTPGAVSNVWPDTGVSTPINYSRKRARTDTTRMLDRRRRVEKKFKDKKITKAQYEAAKENDWYVLEEPDEADSLRCTDATKQRKAKVKAKLKAKKISQAQFDAAAANNWYLTSSTQRSRRVTRSKEA